MDSVWSDVMRIGLGLGIAMQKMPPSFMPGLSNANATGGYAANCAGSLLAYAPNTLRWGCLDGKRAVLVEAGATNILPGQTHVSNTMTGGSQFAQVPFPSVRIFTAPAGTGGRYAYCLSKFSAVAGSTYTVSAWVVSSERYVTILGGSDAFGTDKYAVVDVIDGAVIHAVGCTASVTKMLGMCRVTMTTTASATTAAGSYGVAVSDGSNNRIPSIVTDGTETLTVFGGQVEAGSAATSYIPTSGAATTRAADLVTAPITADVSGGVRVRGTFRLDAVKGGYDRVFQLDNGSNDNRMFLLWDAASSKFQIGLYNGNVGQGFVLFDGPALGDLIEFDLTYTPASITGMFNGVPVSKSLSGGYTPPTTARLGSIPIGTSVPARLLCSEFLVTGV